MEEKQARKRVVLVSVSAQGHISPMMQLAKTLHSKGFLNHSFSDQFATIPESLPESAFEDLGALKFLLKLNIECQVSFKDCLGQLLLQQSNEISCVIYDEFLYFAEAAAKEFKLPNVIFSTTSATAFVCRSVFNNVYGNNGIAPSKESTMELYRNTVDKRTASSVIINTASCLESASLSFLQKQLEIPVYPIGPLHMVASASTSLLEENKSCMEWLNKQKVNSVIYISLGSYALTEINEVMESALKIRLCH
ncbi:hypothetical protein ARALYDRAFT_347751 [Arabidopsis lyrata subsp. lyrata]|uniref:UDP-glucoronosyl/UDP-glucosyl transferase family protein n=1 Tax=Arabidopsis lyrata subsp. lyrata TaxID=81972 RepID=D7LN30_ARALL|nr:hypothetical protein ARALYDRAFT_347751 [Arabidopsis lyrata subsp. lyrata]